MTCKHFTLDPWGISGYFWRLARLLACILPMALLVRAASGQRDRIIDFGAGPMISVHGRDVTVTQALELTFRAAKLPYRIEPEAAEVCSRKMVSLAVINQSAGLVIYNLCMAAGPAMWFDDDGTWVIGLHRITLDVLRAQPDNVALSVLRQLACNFIYAETGKPGWTVTYSCKRAAPSTALKNISEILAPNGVDVNWTDGICSIGPKFRLDELPAGYNPLVTCKLRDISAGAAIDLLCRCCGVSYISRVSLDAQIDLIADAVSFTDVIDHVLRSIPGNKDKHRFYDGYWPRQHGQWMEIGPPPTPISHGL